ncbi:anti-sigma B factor antagonist [Nonomuraea fuscirosea]|uniref:Anti-sigma factor antagonist n=1 Tax=Nonomuraea fuscirosea TaxID=1291556 RepID=A0A2T0M608_9ACTN|nr:STAS domain-containing protein [Nonomuraea fuscirosea]PRX52930.1 anti-sigma B factor antagonist [Nonomuraea fuscirosea]
MPVNLALADMLRAAAMPTALSVTCHPSPVGVLVTVAGEIDATNADRLESAIAGALRPGRPLILDLHGVTFMDSSGLHVLLRVRAEVLAGAGSLHLVSVQERPARLLRITGVWDTLDIHDSVAEAVAALVPPLAADLA